MKTGRGSGVGLSGEWFKCEIKTTLSNTDAFRYYLKYVNPQPEYYVIYVRVFDNIADIHFGHKEILHHAECPWDLEVANPLEDAFNAMQRVAQVAV